MSTDSRVGDYVLAAKWSDADPRDPWAVGFLTGRVGPLGLALVVDGSGEPLRGNYFRYVRRITEARGAWLLARRKEIEAGGRSLRWWLRQRME